MGVFKNIDLNFLAHSVSHSFNYNPEQSKGELSKVRHTGFYYDAQLNDESMVMTLHPSTYNTGGKWVTFGDGYSPFSGGSIKYSKTPIARCLLFEDPTFSVTNNFTDFNGGNPIEGLFNSMKPYAPLLGKLNEKIGETKDDAYGSKINEWVNSAKKVVGKYAGLASESLNKSLFIQGTRFTYYNGSNFATNQLEMKFTKFSEYNEAGQFLDVQDYIATVLAPYCYGVYNPLDTKGAMETQFGTNIGGEVSRFIAEYCGVQTAPGGFKMDAQSLDKALFGTLRLNIGGVYAVENLLVRSMSFSFSKSQAKHPEKPGETCPLYADITLTLCPASMVTDVSFKKMLEGHELGTAKQVRASDNKTQLEKMKNDRKGKFSSVKDKIKNY